MEGRNEAQQSRAQQSTQHSTARTAQHWSQLQQQGEGGRAGVDVERRRERRMQGVRWQQRWEEALKASKKRNQSRSVELMAETAVRALCSVAILRWCLCLLGSFLAVREASPPRPGQWEACHALEVGKYIPDIYQNRIISLLYKYLSPTYLLTYSTISLCKKQVPAAPNSMHYQWIE